MTPVKMARLNAARLQLEAVERQERTRGEYRRGFRRKRRLETILTAMVGFCAGVIACQSIHL